jgi:DNA polymerase-3 subunit delta
MKLAGAAAKRFLAAPPSDTRAILLYGPNRTLVRETASDLTARLLGPSPNPLAVTRLGDEELRDRALLADQLAAQSLLLAGPRVVRVRAEGETAAESLIEAVAALDKDAPAAAFLLVEGGDLPARSKIRAAFENAARSYALAFYEDDEAALARLAADLLKEANVVLDDGAQALLRVSLPSDRALIRSEVEKLALYAHGRRSAISAAEMAALLAVEAEAALDTATAAAIEGNAVNATESFHRSDAGGISAMKALERRLLRLQEARALVDRGAAPSEAAGALRPPIFWKERDAFANRLRQWPTERIAVALDAVWRAQVRAMTAGAPQELIAAEAFRFVASMANRR